MDVHGCPGAQVHGCPWMSRGTSPWMSMVYIHVLLNGIMVKDDGLTDHGQSPWSVKTWSSPWTLQGCWTYFEKFFEKCIAPPPPDAFIRISTVLLW